MRLGEESCRKPRTRSPESLPALLLVRAGNTGLWLAEASPSGQATISWHEDNNNIPKSASCLLKRNEALRSNFCIAPFIGISPIDIISVIPGCPSPTDSEVKRILSLLAVSENAVPESAEGILRVNFSQKTNSTYSYVKKKIRRVVNDLAILQLVNNWIYTFWLSNYFWMNK